MHYVLLCDYQNINGGGEYKKLLDSIESQTIKPEHIYVVQPHGYYAPIEQLGNEEYIHTTKGMWEQRIFGMEYSINQSEHSSYLLVCDDDVSFDSNFVEGLLILTKTHEADILIPISDIKKGWKYQIFGLITGQRTENKTSPYKITIKTNGSFSVNNNLKNNVNLTQSGPFQCFLMKTDIIPSLKLREEKWLDDTRYALPDDQVFFYKAYRLGLNVMSCKTPSFIHLDAKSGSSKKQRENDSYYASGRNYYIFWKKFILKDEKRFTAKVLKIINFNRLILMNRVIFLITGMIKKDLSGLRYYNKGIIDGHNFFKI